MANRKGSLKLSVAIDERIYKALYLKKALERVNITQTIEELLTEFIDEKYFKMVDEAAEVSE